MTSPLSRLRNGLAVLAIIFVVGVLGYRLAGWSLLDAIYMVVLTLSTVGLKEVHDLAGDPKLEAFTILVIVFGVSTSLYIVGVFVQMMTEGEINRALGVRRATREIKRLSGHTVICGFGRVGEILAQELHRRQKPFVVIENNPERISEAASLGYLALNGDATEEDALSAAGVDRASTLATTLPRDADNVFITLTARDLNPKITIIARGEFPTTEKKLLQAGADRVVMPAAAGALRMAAMITRPAALELIEVVAGRQIAEVEVDEVTVAAGSPLVGMSVRDSQTRSRHGLLIVAFRRAGGKLEFNPGGEAVFEAGASVVLLGRQADIDRFRAEYRI
jgi:voltage-gated potassium channel